MHRALNLGALQYAGCTFPAWFLMCSGGGTPEEVSSDKTKGQGSARRAAIRKFLKILFDFFNLCQVKKTRFLATRYKKGVLLLVQLNTFSGLYFPSFEHTNQEQTSVYECDVRDQIAPLICPLLGAIWDIATRRDRPRVSIDGYSCHCPSRTGTRISLAPNGFLSKEGQSATVSQHAHHKYPQSWPS